MTGLRVRGRNAWLTPKPGTVGATTGLSMLAAGAVNPAVTVSTLTITSSSASNGEAVMAWETVLGTDGVKPAGVRTTRGGVDATGTPAWSTDDPLSGDRTFTLLTNGTDYPLTVQWIDSTGALMGEAKTVTVTPNGSTTTTPPPVVVVPSDPTSPPPSHLPALQKVANLGSPPGGKKFWSGGRGDGVDLGHPGFAEFRGKAINFTSTWVDPANGAGWFEGWGITHSPLPDGHAKFDSAFPGVLDLAIGGPSDYTAAAGGSMDAALRQMLINVRKHRVINSPDGKPRPTIIRSCHEMNGTWYPWTVSPGEEAAFLAYNRRARKILDETFPEALFSLCFNGDNNSGLNHAACWDPNVWDIVGVDYYNQYPYIGTSRANAPWEPGKFTSWEDGAYRGTADNPRGIERYRQYAEKRGVPLYIPEWSTSVADHGDDAYFTNRVYDWMKQHGGGGAGQVFGDSWFNIWSGFNSNFSIYIEPGAGGTLRMPVTATAYANWFKANY